MMTRAEKEQEISTIADKFGRAKAAFLVDYKGLNVEEITVLRKKLTPINSELRVVKNTMAKLAIKQYESIDSALSEHLVGTNAVVFAYDDVSEPAKMLKDFSEDHENLSMKTGVLDGNVLTADKIKFLSTLPGKDVLRAQLLGTLAAPMSKFVRTLNEVPSSFVRVLAAKKDG